MYNKIGFWSIAAPLAAIYGVIFALVLLEDWRCRKFVPSYRDFEGY